MELFIAILWYLLMFSTNVDNTAAKDNSLDKPAKNKIETVKSTEIDIKSEDKYDKIELWDEKDFSESDEPEPIHN